MSNLIITILGIALAAITVIFGLSYVSDNFTANQNKIRANILIEQSRQLMAANLSYMVDNGKSSFSDFGPDMTAIAQYTSGRVPLLVFPALGNGGSALGAGMQRHETCQNSSTVTSLDNYPVTIARTNCRINGKDSILYWVVPKDTSCGLSHLDLSSVANINHPLVQMCLEINKRTVLPAGLTYSPTGIPYGTGSAQTCPANNAVEYFDGAGQNYCYISTGGYVGANQTLYMTFTK